MTRASDAGGAASSAALLRGDGSGERGGSAAPQMPDALNAEYQRGLQDGRTEARRELTAVLGTANRLAQALQRESGELRRDVNRNVATLSLRIAAKVIAREVRGGEDLQRLLANALAQLPERHHLTIRLHPADLKLLEPFRNKPLDKRTQLPEDVVLVADESILRGGCVIDSPMGQLDARVDTQLALIEAALLAEDAREGEAPHA